MKKLKFTKLTKLEIAWVLYDVGNSAFILLVSTLFPVYFNAVAEQDGIEAVDYLAYWGYAASIVTVIVALMGPVLGALADTKGYRKPIFTASMLVGVLGCMALGFTKSWMTFLVIFIIARTGYSASLIFYDSMIIDVTSEERMDDVSSRGFAWGYIGSCIPFAVGLYFVLFGGKLGIDKMSAMTFAFMISAVWWFAATMPLLNQYNQRHYVEVEKSVVRNSFRRLFRTLKNVKQEKQIFLFLFAFFFYIDGVYTIIDMATAYGTALGLDTAGLLIALLLTQIAAFPATILFGRLSGKYSTKILIPVCIAAYTVITVFAFFLDSQIKFWILAVCVGMFQGGIQALSRSHFAKIIPADKSGEYFGLFDICGKGASFLGTMLVSFASQLTGSPNIGIASLIVLFILGLILFIKSSKMDEGTITE